MREHTNLTTVMGFMREHVAEHLRACRPGASPAVAAKHTPASVAGEYLSQHRSTAGRALGECFAYLLRRALAAVELWWSPDVRRRKSHPLAANIVHVGEDRGDGPDVARRFGSPRRRIDMFDESLVDAIVGSKYLGGSAVQLRLGLA